MNRLFALAVLSVVGTPWCSAADENGKAEKRAWTIPADHPRLLVHRNEILLLRIRCGLETDSADAVDGADPASVKVFKTLRGWVDDTMRRIAPPGFLYSTGLMHLLAGQIGKPDAYSRYVTEQLLRDGPRLSDGDDEVIAFDWCWDAIPPLDRERIARRLLADATPLSPEDSPFQHITFFPKLRALAMVLTAYGEDLRRLGLEALGEEILKNAVSYLEESLPLILRERGALGTSPTASLTENFDAAFAAEIWQTGTGHPMWARLRRSLGRACEPYFYAMSEASSDAIGFLHDDGAFAPSRPSAAPHTSAPVLPWILGRRTGDPFAGYFARTQLVPGALQPHEDPLARHWWARIVYAEAARRAVARDRCPLARNLGGGWIAMRSGFSPDSVRILFDAGQPIFRSRQHFDAGHFMIARNHLLTQGGGQDVTLQAVSIKGGSVTIASKKGEWETYFQSTGAHNCITVTDRLYRQKRFGKIWGSGDGQRIVQGEYKPAERSVAEAGRQRGRLLAFQSEPRLSYAACDLTQAYPERIVKRYVREFLFLHAGAILVIDRVTVKKPEQRVRWNLQLINRPKLGERDLADSARIVGKDSEAGIWSIRSAADWLHVDNGSDRLYVRTILPFDHQWRIIGGPKKTLTVEQGRHVGVEYVGGSSDSFEHWLYPPRSKEGVNAWYRLGRPSGLGPHFEQAMHWGHIEVQAITPTTDTLFCHVLVPVGRTDPPPKLDAQIRESVLDCDLTMSSERVRVRFSLDGTQPAEARGYNLAGDQLRWSYQLATDIRPDAPIPIERF